MQETPLRIALLQINPTAGDLAGNAALIVKGARQAASAGADLVVTPELALMLAQKTVPTLKYAVAFSRIRHRRPRTNEENVINPAATASQPQ